MTHNPSIDPAEISPAACVANNLRKITRTIIHTYEEALQESGITIGQFSTLGTLNQTGPLPIQKLAAAMEIDRTTLARNLKPMIRNGLVEIMADPTDGRAKIVHLTHNGQITLAKAGPSWLEVQKYFLAGLGEEQVTQMISTFGDLAALARKR